MGNQNPEIEGQTRQWPKWQEDKRTSNEPQNTTQKTKDRATRTPLMFYCCCRISSKIFS